MASKLRIGHVARSLGVTAHYLRLLEQEKRIPEASYDRAGRFYSEADIELLKSLVHDQATFSARDRCS